MMDSSGFSFPARLRVLVVDDDRAWLKILEKMLKICDYQVITCNLAREALDLLRERKDGFDIVVISDVIMPDMDGFKLLKHVHQEMDLPVIMMSVDGETSRTMKGVQYGACNYLIKPIRMEELQNIWQHVFRKRIHEARDIKGQKSLEEIQMMKSATELSDDGHHFIADIVPGKKRKNLDNKNDDRVCGDPSNSKKARVVWSVDLNQKFVNAVNLIGLEKAVPKEILKLMGEPWLTRDHVASHLQKYRLNLSRLQKESDTKATVGGTKHSELSPKDLAGNVCSKIPEGSIKSNLSIPTTEWKTERNDLAKSSTSNISFEHSSAQLNSDAISEPRTQDQYSWSAGVPQDLFKQKQKAHGRVPPLQFKNEPIPVLSVEQQFDHIPLPIHPIQVDCDHPMQSTRSQQREKVTEVESTAALFSVQPESHLTDCQAIDPIPSSIRRTKSQNLEHNLFYGPESCNSKCTLQTETYPPNPEFGSIDPFSFSSQDFTDDVPSNLDDSLKFDFDFDFDFSFDPVEYPVMDQSLFIS